MERDLDCAAKEGGRPAADEIELEADEEGKYDDEVSPRFPMWSSPSGTYGENMRPFGHGRGRSRGCGRCGSSKEVSVPLTRVRVAGWKVNEPAG
jgi:hypothetical protein